MNGYGEAAAENRQPLEWDARLLSGFLRRRVLALLSRLEHGGLILREGNRTLRFGSFDDPELQAVVTVHSSRLYRTLALQGTVGAGEAYMDGDWTCDDLTALVRIFARNRQLLAAVEGGLSRLGGILLSLYHRRRRNTHEGSRRNIREHYDLGNDFFSLFLDSTLMYSAAWFEREDVTLEEASFAKLEMICRKLDLGPGDHLVEIGTGWGGFAIHAAGRYGCRVTTTTISREQYRLARERVTAAGLSDRVQVLLEDYRDLRGSFDKLVSIEMIEAVGYEFLETYFRRCHSLLRPGGRALIQAITIADELLDEARRSVDFIKRYIFPGSALPSLGQIRSLAALTGLRIEHLDDLTLHYARTLQIWRDRFLAARREVESLGYPERFLRMWEYYLCYCEGGFRERHIGDYQVLFSKDCKTD